MSNLRIKNIPSAKLLGILSRFTKDDIITNILPAKVEKLDIDIRKKKDIFLKETLKLLREKFSDLDELILFLNLQYNRCVKRKRKWNVLKIENAKRLANSDLPPDKVSTTIHKYFTKYNTECKVRCEKEDGCIWIVLLLGGSIYKPIHCIVHMQLSLIFLSNSISSSSLLTEKLLRKTFRGSELKRLTSFPIEGKNIARLTIKSWNNLYKKIAPQDRKKKVSDSIQEQNKELNNSEQNITPRDRTKKVSDSIKEQNKVINNSEQHIIIHSEVQSPKKRFKVTEFEKCAKKSVPVITDLQYKIRSTGLCKKGKENLSSCVCVKFQGTNILKGLDKLIECGIADAPLPDYLYKEPRSGKTEYILR